MIACRSDMSPFTLGLWMPVQLDRRQRLTRRIITLPQGGERHPHDRVPKVRVQFGERPQHEGTGQDLGARQHRRAIQHLLIVTEQIQIQGPGGELAGIGRAAMGKLQSLERGHHLLDAAFGLRLHHQVIEVGATETDGRTLIDARETQGRKLSRQRLDAQRHMALRLYVAANPDVDESHQASRTISTPTPRAAATAVGLVTRTRTRGTANSCRISAATRSAMVSTSSTGDSCTKAVTREATQE